MQTEHRVLIADARDMGALAAGSVQLVLTSPPYPMVALWDETFTALDPAVGPLLAAGQGMEAFARMHAVLDAVWAGCARVLCPGGLLCVNIGDATRSIGGCFGLYPNHARISAGLMALGLMPLPDIIWRKPTNAPTKFLGSGMLPGGAYVTYEHEYILIFRKPGKRVLSAADRERRAASAYFWHERNTWFSDLWDALPGAGQRLDDQAPRQRSAAFPFELPWRLIHMYSLQGDRVLDPFVGTGTTMAAALAAGRSSVGVELIDRLRPLVESAMARAFAEAPARAAARLAAQASRMQARALAGKSATYALARYDIPVVTRQEVAIAPLVPTALQPTATGWLAEHTVLSRHAVPGA